MLRTILVSVFEAGKLWEAVVNEIPETRRDKKVPHYKRANNNNNNYLPYLTIINRDRDHTIKKKLTPSYSKKKYLNTILFRIYFKRLNKLQLTIINTFPLNCP